MTAVARASALLKDIPLPVYDVGAHLDVCRAPYAVLRNAGSYPTTESARLTYSLLTIYLYVPLDGNQTELLEKLTRAVKSRMRAMRDQARATGNEGQDTIEGDYKALSRALEYQVLKKE